MALAHAPDPNKIPMSVEEYFRLDEKSEDTKYEYIDGYAVAMAGGSSNHSVIGGNVVTALNNTLSDTPCRVYNSDIYLKMDTKMEKKYFHPDAAVSCDEEDNTGIRRPKLLIEVLSPGTENYDRREKYQSYRTIPSLEEYVLISSHIMSVEVHRREQKVWWVYYPFGPGDIVELTSINAKIPIEQLYRKVKFPEE